MIDLSVTIDVSQAQAALDRAADPQNAQRIAERVADEVVIPNLAKSPPASGKAQPFKSDKSRRYFFAALADGSLQVPYQRSGATGASYDKQPQSDGLLLISSLPSAEFTRGPGQAAYHRGNWLTHEDIARESEGDAALSATAAMVDIIGDAGP